MSPSKPVFGKDLILLGRGWWERSCRDCVRIEGPCHYPRLKPQSIELFPMSTTQSCSKLGDLSRSCCPARARPTLSWWLLAPLTPPNANTSSKDSYQLGRWGHSNRLLRIRCCCCVLLGNFFWMGPATYWLTHVYSSSTNPRWALSK